MPYWAGVIFILSSRHNETSLTVSSPGDSRPWLLAFGPPRLLEALAELSHPAFSEQPRLYGLSKHNISHQRQCDQGPVQQRQRSETKDWAEWRIWQPRANQHDDDRRY